MFSSASFAEENTHSVTLQWDSVDHATSYRLEERLDSASWDDAVIIDTSDTNVTLSERAERDYVYRVIGCVNNPVIGESPLCSEEIAEFSDEYPITIDSDISIPINIEHSTAPELANLPPEDILSTTIGTIAGQFRVDETGASTYTVPLSVPKGKADVTPQIAINCKRPAIPPSV